MHAPTPLIRRLALGLAIALALVACAGGAEQSAEQPGGEDIRTIDVRMVDIAYEPASIDVAEGETVRLRFTNDGELPHDAFIGDEAAQAAHEAEMAAEDHGGHGEGDTDAITVQPGSTGELVHTFTAGEEVRIGCHQPGHYEAGMVLDVTVS